jgi:DNA-binding transcriptional MerR regulator
VSCRSPDLISSQTDLAVRRNSLASTTMSTLPVWFMTVSRYWLTAASSRTWTAEVCATPPLLLIYSAIAFRLESVRPARNTRAPSAANSLATAAPIEPPARNTTALLFPGYAGRPRMVQGLGVQCVDGPRGGHLFWEIEFAGGWVFALTLYRGVGFMMVAMRTGELARQAGVNIQTIRFYERQCLLASPPRTAAGYRCYSRQDLERVIFIKTCQQLGFTLRDIHSLAELHGRLARVSGGRAGTAERSKIAAIARDRLRQIDEKLHQLSEMRAHLQTLCDVSPEEEPHCPATRLQKSC